jgi:hypothetical protein
MRYALLATAAAAALSLSVAQGLAQPSSSGGMSGQSGQSGQSSGQTTQSNPTTSGQTQSSPTTSGQTGQQNRGAAQTGQSNQGTAPTGQSNQGTAQTGNSGRANTGDTGTSGSAATNNRDGNRDAARGSGSSTSTSTGSVSSSSVNVSSEQRTQITRAFSSVNVAPVTNVNFEVRTGTVLPATVNLHPCPRQVIDILTGIRECQFVIVKNEIVIVEPSSRRIVTVIERRG